jgi:hypothetical protein
MSRHSDFVTLVRQESVAVLDAIDNLNALRKEYDQLDYSNTLGNDAFVGSNADVTKAELMSVIGTTLDSLNALMAAGHGTNLQRMR